MRIFDLQQIISEATRITPITSSIIDHILTDSKERLSQYGVISVGLSDHFMTFCTRKISKQTFNKHYFSKVRCIKNYTSEIFIDKLQNADWSKYFYAENVNNAWLVF